MGLYYTPTEYITFIRMSEHKHLLVEGKDDQRCFEQLFDAFRISNNGDIGITQPEIESAEILVQFPSDINIGNRDKVVEIATLIERHPWCNRFVGFVDREFRDFYFDKSKIDDKLMNHNVINRLVWSRGHSLENYCFNIEALRGPFQDNTDVSYYKEAIDFFEQRFCSLICLACALGIVGFQRSMLKELRSLLTREELLLGDSSNHKVGFKSLNISEKLQKRFGRSSDDANGIVIDIKDYQTRLEEVSFDIVRWACDGHIGRKLIWEAYCGCVEVIGEKIEGQEKAKKNAHQIMRQEDRARFYSVARAWAEKALCGKMEYPAIVFDMIGVK